MDEHNIRTCARSRDCMTQSASVAAPNETMRHFRTEKKSIRPNTLYVGLRTIVLSRRCSKRRQLCAAREKWSLWSMVLTSFTVQPEQATMSALVDTTERKLDSEPNSPVKSLDGSPLRQMKTRHRESPFQKLTDMNLFEPAFSNSIPKH